MDVACLLLLPPFAGAVFSVQHTPLQMCVLRTPCFWIAVLCCSSVWPDRCCLSLPLQELFAAYDNISLQMCVLHTTYF